MKKVFVLILSLFIINCSLFSQAINVGVLIGPSCIPIVKMMDAKESDYKYETFASPQNLLPKMLKDEIDIGFMPLNIAAKVFNSSNKKLLCAVICGGGNLSLITKDKKIKNLSDLKNKTVVTAGKGATPEYLIKYLLTENNIAIDEKNGVFLDFSIPTASIVPLLLSDKIKYVILPEPYSTIATSKSNEVYYSIDLQDEFEKITKTTSFYPLTAIVVRSEFAINCPEKVKDFLKNYETSSVWVQNNPKEAGLLCEKLQLGLDSNIVEHSIPKSNYVFRKSSDSKEEIEHLLKIFLQNDENSIGGKLPDSSFYLNW